MEVTILLQEKLKVFGVNCQCHLIYEKCHKLETMAFYPSYEANFCDQILV